MISKETKNSIVSFILIVSTMLMPLSFLPEKAEAQYGTLGGISGYTRGLAPAIAKLPQCQKELGSGIKKLFNGIFGSGETGGSVEEGRIGNLPVDNLPTKSLLSPKSSVLRTAVPSLDEKASSTTIQVTTPAVSDAEVKRLLDNVNKSLKLILGETEAINENSSCIQSIGRLIAKMLLQKLTQSTVNWINSGFDGSPSFIQDAGKFFGDIAKTEILQFGIEIEGISPFSRDWMRNNALAVRNKFADNAQYSLDEMIASTTPGCVGEDGVLTGCSESFRKDFSMGGWDAWTAMTQVPANNPLGAKLMFDNEIQKRLAGTDQSVAQNTRDALQAASGFLGDKHCITATGQINNYVTWTDYQKGLEKTPPEILCSSWKYVTPGKMVADAATNVIGYQNNSLLNVEDLNDAVAAVLDALLNQFSTSIYEKGFANLDYQGIDGVLVFNNSNSDFRTQTEKDFMPSHLSSSWLQANPDFDIRTDLTQALIDEQRTYSDKLALQNRELMSTTDGKDYNIEVCPDGWTGTYPNCTGPLTTTIASSIGAIKVGNLGGVSGTCPSGWTGTYPNCKGPGGNNLGVSNAYGLMPAIYQLDYCIPGPHPGWEDDSRETLNNISIPEKETSSDQTTQIANGVVGVGIAIGASFIPGVGSVVGPVLSSIFGAITGDSAQASLSTSIRGYYTNKFHDFTGYKPQAPRSAYQSTDPVHVNMMSSEGVSFVLNKVLDRYINIMRKTYFSSPDKLPTITQDAAKEFNQLPGYNQMIKDNKNKMLEIKTTVSILGEIKDAVDKLNTQLEDGYDENGNVFTETDYENQLKAQINAFGRLSASMVNGDDIANANDLAQQIVLKKNYIYKNLLKGPYGCEADLEKPQKNFPSAGLGVKQTTNDWSNYNVNSIKRASYPFPIIYDYSSFTKGTTLPDPWESGYESAKLPKMPVENQYDKYGPGFLNFVHFSANYASYKDATGSERLSLGGLVYDYDPGYEGGEKAKGKDGLPYFANVSVGEIGPEGKGPFEKTIGIY